MIKDIRKIESTLIDEAIKELNDYGYTKIENIIDLNIIYKIENFLNSFIKNKDNIKSLKNFQNASIFHGDSLVINNLHARDILFWELISNPIISSICEKVLSKYSYMDSEGYVLLGSAIRALFQKQTSQQLHIDSNLPGNNHILSLQFCIPLDPFNKLNGATQIIKDSYKLKYYPPNADKLSKELIKKSLIIEANPGDLIVFNTSLWHGSSDKQTNSRRAAIFINFGRWFLKPSFDIPNNIPKEIYEKLSNNQKKIAGCYFQPPLNDLEDRGRKSKNPIIRKYIEE